MTEASDKIICSSLQDRWWWHCNSRYEKKQQERMFSWTKRLVRQVVQRILDTVLWANPVTEHWVASQQNLCQTWEWTPGLLGDPDSYTLENLNTPSHIKPEWYFLFTYAVLQSSPKKLGRILAQIFSILILVLIPLLHTCKQQSMTFSWLSQYLFWILVVNHLTLAWTGGQSAEHPFIITGQLASIICFSLSYYQC